MDHRLARVLWIGGSPCSGRSTMADRLAAAFGLGVFRCDDAYERHKAELDHWQRAKGMTAWGSSPKARRTANLHRSGGGVGKLDGPRCGVCQGRRCECPGNGVPRGLGRRVAYARRDGWSGRRALPVRRRLRMTKGPMPENAVSRGDLSPRLTGIPGWPRPGGGTPGAPVRAPPVVNVGWARSPSPAE